MRDQHGYRHGNYELLTLQWPLKRLSISGTTATATSGPTDNFTVDVYAGSEPTQCGNSFTNGTGAPGGGGVAAGSGSTAAAGTSVAPTLSGDTIGQSVAISAALTYQD